MRCKSSGKSSKNLPLNWCAGRQLESSSEEGEICSESLVRILMGLNRDLEGLLTCDGGNETDSKMVRVLSQIFGAAARES